MSPETLLTLHYRQEAVLHNELIAKLSFLVKVCLEMQRKFKGVYPADDVRPQTFRKIAPILSYYKLSLCYTFGILSRIDNMSLILDSPQTRNISPEEAASVLKEYEQYITFSFFHVVFSSIEGSMRSLVGLAQVIDRKGKRCRQTAKFSDVYTGLVDYTGVDRQYVVLFDLLSMVRNCIHNRGIFISDKGDKSLTYKDVTYDFVQGKPISFANIDLIFNSLMDILRFFDEVFSAEGLKREPYMNDIV